MSTQLPQALNFDVTPEPSEDEFNQFNALAQLGNGESKPVTQENERQDFFVNTELQDGKLVVTYIGSSFSPEDSNLILDYYPRLYGVYSEHLGYQILTEKHLFLHLEAEGLRALSEDGNVVIGKRRQTRVAAKPATDPKYKAEYTTWENVCSDRKNRIKVKRNEMRALISERDALVLEYNQRIGIIRAEVLQVEAEPIPPRPMR